MDNVNSRIKFEELKNLQIEIQLELGRVEETLREVHEATMTTPQEDDSIMKEIESIGNNMHESWGRLTDTFRQTCDEMKKSIDVLFRFIQSQSEKAKNIRKDL